MGKGIYQLQKENTISKILLGEKRINKEKKQANGFFYCLFVSAMLAIIILISNKCIQSINIKFILNMVFIGLFLFILIVWLWLTCNYRKSRIKIIQEKIPEYKPEIILGGMINKTLFKGIDWGNYYIKKYWFEQLEIKYQDISTKEINFHLSLIKYDLIDKPRLDYSTLIGVVTVIISFISLININIPIGVFFNVGEIKTKEDLFYYIMLWAIIFITISAVIKLFVDMNKQNYREKLNKYEENLRWCQAFEYILHEREIEEKSVKSQKNDPMNLFCKVLDKIISRL